MLVVFCNPQAEDPVPGLIADPRRYALGRSVLVEESCRAIHFFLGVSSREALSCQLCV